MAIFNSYVSLPEGMHDIFYCLDGVHIKVLGGASHLVNGLRNTHSYIWNIPTYIQDEIWVIWILYGPYVYRLKSQLGLLRSPVLLRQKSRLQGKRLPPLSQTWYSSPAPYTEDVRTGNVLMTFFDIWVIMMIMTRSILDGYFSPLVFWY